MVVDVGGAVGAVVAVDGVAWGVELVGRIFFLRVFVRIGFGIFGGSGEKEGGSGSWRGEGECLGTRVTGVGVCFCGTLCDLEVALVGHLIESELAATEELAGVAVAAKREVSSS